jgi:protein TonB
LKQLFISISLALLLHAILLFGDFSRLQLFSAVSPELKTVTMTLVAYSPRQKADRPIVPPKEPSVDEATEAMPDIHDPLLFPLPEMPLREEPVEPASDMPITDPPISPAEENQIIAPEPALPPETEPDQPSPDLRPGDLPDPVARETDSEPGEPSQMWQKPKRSLKALTRVTPKAAKPVRRPNRMEAAPKKPVQKKGSFSAALPSTPRSRPKTEKAGSDAANPATSESSSSASSAPEDTAGKVASVNRDVPAPKIRMARPLYRRNPPPDYPSRARRRGVEGTVILEVLVNETGQVEELALFKSSGHELLDRAARVSVKKWLFQPGTRDGQTVKMWVRVPIRFSLN